MQFSRVKYVNIVLKQIFRVFSFCRIETALSQAPSPWPPFLALSLALCSLLGSHREGNHSMNSKAFFKQISWPEILPARSRGFMVLGQENGFCKKILHQQRKRGHCLSRVLLTFLLSPNGPVQRSVQRLSEPRQSIHAIRASQASSDSPGFLFPVLQLACD